MSTYESDRTSREESPMFVPEAEPETESEAKPEMDYNWKAQVWNSNQNTYIAQVSMVYVPSQATMTAQLLHAFKKQLNTLDNVSFEEKKRRLNALKSLHTSIQEAHSRDVTEADLNRERFLPRLKRFLSPDRAEAREDMYLSDFLVDQLTIIYKKWSKGDYLCDPNRGLNVHINFDRNGNRTKDTYTLNKAWEFWVDHHYFGAGDLVNGQIWYSRTQLMRDGVHGSKIGGISGNSKKGAYSIIVGLHDGSHDYTDVDLLQEDTLIYEGTSLDKPTPLGETILPTPVTRAMLMSEKTQLPVRVVRAILDLEDRKFYRYDGLYQVTASTLIDGSLQTYTFTMTRIPGQSVVFDKVRAPVCSGSGEQEGQTQSQ